MEATSYLSLGAGAAHFHCDLSHRSLTAVPSSFYALPPCGLTSDLVFSFKMALRRGLSVLRGMSKTLNRSSRGRRTYYRRAPPPRGGCPNCVCRPPLSSPSNGFDGRANLSPHLVRDFSEASPRLGARMQLLSY
jgi:hypothetical protein